MKLLKTNTKQYINNIKNALQSRFKDIEIKDFNDLLMAFNNECNNPYEKRNFPNLQNRIANWLQNAGGFGWCYEYEYLNFAAEVHELEKIPENKEKVIIKNFNNHIAFFLLKFADQETKNKLY